MAKSDPEAATTAAPGEAVSISDRLYADRPLRSVPCSDRFRAQAVLDGAAAGEHRAEPLPVDDPAELGGQRRQRQAAALGGDPPADAEQDRQRVAAPP